MTNFRKFTALLLSLIMIIGAVPAVGLTALAEGMPTLGEYTYDSATHTLNITCDIPTGFKVGDEIEPMFYEVKSKEDYSDVGYVTCSWLVETDSAENVIFSWIDDEGYDRTQYYCPILSKGKYWIDPTAFMQNGETPVFEKGKMYAFSATLVYSDRWLGKSDTKITVNNKDFEVIELQDPIASYSYNVILDFGTLDENGNFSGGDFDPDVKLENIATDITVAQPVCGEKLATKDQVTIAVTSSMPENSVDAEINEITWTDENDTSQTTAESNVEYTANVEFKLSPKTGYKITENTTVTATINGETVESKKSDGNYSFSYKFKLVHTETTNIDLTIPEPQVEQKLAEKATVNFKTDPANALTVDAENIYWTDSNENIAKLAKCCGEYTANVYLDLAVIEGYKFTKDTAVTATVNGKKVEVKGDYENGFEVSYTFNKIQHTWDDGKVVKNATTKHGAVRLFTCTVCQKALRTEYLPQSKQTIKLLKKKYKAKNNTVKIKAKAKGSKLRFRALNKSKYYRVNKYGRIRFRNGAKGTYKIKVRIRALVNNSYKQATTTKVIKVKVK